MFSKKRPWLSVVVPVFIFLFVYTACNMGQGIARHVKVPFYHATTLSSASILTPQSRESILGPLWLQQQVLSNKLFPASIEATRTHGPQYSRIVVIPCVETDDTTWIQEQLNNTPTAIYNADDPAAHFHPPKNKGHEVMIYLTYIIDHYHELPDVIVFMHAHRFAWHNDELLGSDAAEMIRRLSNERVVREGYMNMRCQWDPGCPEWLHPYVPGELLNKQEQSLLAKCWHELFPLDPLPTVLAQPCCAQFAVSKGHVLAVPLDRFIFYRDWLLRTPLTDYVSGRLWEFTWQYVFTGRNTYCPAEHACYCDGFGVCFGGESQYKTFLEIRGRKRSFEIELAETQQGHKTNEEGGRGQWFNGVSTVDIPEADRHTYLVNQIDALDGELESRRLDAIARGSYIANRTL